MVTGLIHRQQAQRPCPLRLTSLHGHQVGAENRLDPVGKSRLVGFQQPVEIAHIGDRHRRHVEPGDALHQGLYSDQSVDQGVFGMEAQVDEIGHGKILRLAPKMLYRD